MFFTNSRIRSGLISWLDCEQNEKNRYKKKNHNKHSSVLKVLR